MVETERKMIVSITLPLPDQLGRHIRQQGSRRWGAMLIGHHIQLFPLKSQSQDRFCKIIPMGSDYPACTNNEMSGLTLLKRDLAISLGPPIDTLWIRKILFRIGALVEAIEHIVGRVMHHPCS